MSIRGAPITRMSGGVAKSVADAMDALARIRQAEQEASDAESGLQLADERLASGEADTATAQDLADRYALASAELAAADARKVELEERVAVLTARLEALRARRG